MPVDPFVFTGQSAHIERVIFVRDFYFLRMSKLCHEADGSSVFKMLCQNYLFLIELLVAQVNEMHW